MNIKQIFNRQAMPTKSDFDKATEQEWSKTTCLVAQMMIRRGVPIVDEQSPVQFACVNGIVGLMLTFDVHYYFPSYASYPKLFELRASLPNRNWPWQRHTVVATV